MSTALDQLQGTWHVISMEVDGGKLTAATLGDAKIVITGNNFTTVAMGTTYEGTLELGSTTKLKTFDLLFVSGPEKGNRNLGIYTLDGDRWTICLATRGAKRPRTFATKPDTGLALETLQREGTADSAGTVESQRKPSRSRSSRTPSAEHEVVSSGSATDLEGEWKMISAVFGGDILDQNMVKWCKRITHGNITTVVAGPQTMLKASFVLNNTTRPHSIDYMNLAGATKGKAQAGIYELSGDTLKICMSPPGQQRPKDFSSKLGDGRSYTTWLLATKLTP